MEERLVHAGGLDDGAEEHGEPAVLRIGFLDRSDASGDGVGVEALPRGVLRERLGGAHAPRRGLESVERLLAGIAAADVPAAEPRLEVVGVDGMDVAAEQSGAVELAEKRRDAAGAVEVFDVPVVGIRRDFRQARHLAGEIVDVAQVEVNLALLRGGEGVEDRVRGSSHGDVHRHGVEERVAGGDAAGKHRIVVPLVVSLAQIDDAPPCLHEQIAAAARRCKGRAVSREREPEGLGQAVHGIGREHARARAACGTRAFLDESELIVGQLVVG